MSKLRQYTIEARQVLAYAHEEAVQLRHKTVEPEHIMFGILSMHDPIIESVFAKLHIDPTRLREGLEFVVYRGSKALISPPTLSPLARTILTHAEEEATIMGAERVGVEHLFLGLLNDEVGITPGLLLSFGLYPQTVRREVLILLRRGRDYAIFATHYQANYNQTPTLNQVSRDLTAMALDGKLDPLIGRATELERTMQILSRRTKNNPVLLGSAGVGKTAIAEGLAQRIVQGQVPEQLLHHRVVALDVGLLTADTKFRGDFEERLKHMMQEIVTLKRIIIVIDELHSFFAKGVAEGSIDAANLFKPLLARGEFRCIGATTLSDYRKTIETDSALERRFQPVMVAETTQAETVEILQGLRACYADFHRVTFTEEALLAAVHLSSRYIPHRLQPDNAIDLLDEAASYVHTRRAGTTEAMHLLREELHATGQAKDEAIVQCDFSRAADLRHSESQLREQLYTLANERTTIRQGERPPVTREHIAEVVAHRTGIPVAQVATAEAERLLHLEEELQRRVIGQSEAVQAVARAMRRARTNLRDSRRPIGSFVFVGPSGVGKTELAHALAASLFADEQALLKLDMSEFRESHSVSRLTGAPPGYIGYDQGGQLTEAIRRRPYSIVLFDEIEKAHPQVFDLLLQILEDGCLTDSHGQTVDFKNTLLILTSNIGTVHAEQADMTFTAGRGTTHVQQHNAHRRRHAQVMSALHDLFLPELLNRIDEVVLFHLLGQAQLRAIVDMMLAETQARLTEQSRTLQVTDAARSLLVEHGYDPMYGARPLRRTVQRMLDDLLAEMILSGTFPPGDTVVVDVVNGQLAAHVPHLVAVQGARQLRQTADKNRATAAPISQPQT